MRRQIALSRRQALAVTILGTVGIASGSHAAQPVVAELTSLFDKHWQDRYAGKEGGLTFLALRPEAEVFASTLPGVTPQSHFRGASTTKTFTAAAIMLLDQRDQLRIDDLVTASMPGRSEPYLPAKPDFDIPFKEQITIRQLLSHWAGVFDVTNDVIPADRPVPYAGQSYLVWRTDQDPTHSFTKDELIGVVARNRVSHSAPGAAYHYSDTHYAILGKIVEQVSGMAFDQFKNHELLQPNGLAETRFVIDGHETKLPSPSIAGFTLEKGRLTPAGDYNYSYDPGSGNVFTTPSDLARWIRRLVRGEAGVSKEQVARMCDVTPEVPYGLGLLHKTAGTVDLGFGHNGGTAGYLTDVFHNPKTDVTYLMQCSLIDFDDLRGQMAWLAGIEVAALEIIVRG